MVGGQGIGAALAAVLAGLALAGEAHGAVAFDNGEWVVERLSGSGIPERPFVVVVDGRRVGRARLLGFSSRVGRRRSFPQALVVGASGYLRVKAGGDPQPPLPFGQSLVLGPAVFGTSETFRSATLFSNPQIQRVAVSTHRLRRSGRGPLSIHVVARDRGLAPVSVRSNQVMDLTWRLTLGEPMRKRTRLRVRGALRFTERFVPDPVRSAERQSFRLFQISSMFIDDARHDVDALRYRTPTGPALVTYRAADAGTLVPAIPHVLARRDQVVESLHTDNRGLPNGNTPSYRIEIERTSGPIAGPLSPRAYITPSDDLNDDNLGLWVHRRPRSVIAAGSRGTITYTVTATTNPLAPRASATQRRSTRKDRLR